MFEFSFYSTTLSVMSVTAHGRYQTVNRAL